MAQNKMSSGDGLTDAFRSLQWTIRDLNSTVDQLGQSYEGVKRSQGVFGWAGAIMSVLLLTALVWMANDIVQLRNQLDKTANRFDVLDAQIVALNSQLANVDIKLSSVGADIAAAKAGLGAGGNAPQPAGVVQAALRPGDVGAAPAGDEAQGGAIPTADGNWLVAPSPTAPREQLSPDERSASTETVTEPEPAAAEPAAEAPAEVAAVEPTEVPAAAEEAAPPKKKAKASGGGKLSDSALLAYDDAEIDSSDELLLLDENGQPK